MSADDVAAPDAPSSPAAEQPTAFDLPDAPSSPVESKPKRARKPRSTTPAPRRKSTADIRNGMIVLYAQAGALVSAIPSGPVGEQDGRPVTATQVVGLTIMEQASAAASAWEEAAKANPKVREALEKMLAVSTFGLLFAAHMPILVAVGVVTGVIPPQIAGTLEAMDAAGEQAKG